MAFTDEIGGDVAKSYSDEGSINYGQMAGIFGDILGDGLNAWVAYEENKAVAESNGAAQEEARSTAQTPSGQRPYANPMAAGLPNLNGVHLLIGAGVLILGIWLIK